MTDQTPRTVSSPGGLFQIQMPADADPNFVAAFEKLSGEAETLLRNGTHPGHVCNVMFAVLSALLPKVYGGATALRYVDAFRDSLARMTATGPTS